VNEPAEPRPDLKPEPESEPESGRGDLISVSFHMPSDVIIVDYIMNIIGCCETVCSRFKNNCLMMMMRIDGAREWLMESMEWRWWSDKQTKKNMFFMFFWFFVEMCVRNFFRASSRHCASSATKKQTSD
jgi:hypothetical protein